MKPMQPSPLFHGSRTASAKAVATTASTALPPAASTSAPTARGDPVLRRDDAAARCRDRLSDEPVLHQAAPSQSHLDRIDAGLVEGVVAGEAHRLVIGRLVAPDGVLRPAFRPPAPSTAIVQYEQSPLNGQ